MTKAKLEKRYTVKRFDPDKKVDDEKLELIKEAFHLAPSSMNMQSWKMFIVENQEIKDKLSEAAMKSNSNRIKNCSHLLVLTAKKIDKKHIDNVINTTPLFQLLMKKMNLSFKKFSTGIWFMTRQNGSWRFAVSQVYIALGFLLGTMASLGVESATMEGIKKRKMDKILNLDSNYRTVVVVAVGYPHEDDLKHPEVKQKSRFPKDQVIEVV